MITDIKKYSTGDGLEAAIDMTEVQYLEQLDSGRTYIGLRGGHSVKVYAPYSKVLKDWLDKQTFMIDRKEGGLGV